MARGHAQRLLTVAAAVGITAGAVTLAVTPSPAGAASAPPLSTARSPFRIVPSPSPGRPSLVAAAAISADDVWAVGYTEDASYRPHNLAEHWDGSTWSVVATPDGGGFTAVSAVSSDDVWAIGDPAPFAQHWDGTKWTRIPLKAPTDPNNYLEFTGVKAISPTSVYAVGDYQGYQDPVQVIEHWNGTRWRVMANPFDAVIPSGIDASSAADIWIVGRQRSGTFTEHFNGTKWRVVATPASYYLNAVVDLSPTDAWATGNDISHWDGKSWKVVVANVPGSVGAITSVSPTDLWAVGSDVSGTGTSVEHFNGTSWTAVKTPSPPIDSAITGISSAGGHVYAVGFTAPDNFSSKTLVLENDQG